MSDALSSAGATTTWYGVSERASIAPCRMRVKNWLPMSGSSTPMVKVRPRIARAATRGR